MCKLGTHQRVCVPSFLKKSNSLYPNEEYKKIIFLLESKVAFVTSSAFFCKENGGDTRIIY
jgi:hypothetical protein